MVTKTKKRTFTAAAVSSFGLALSTLYTAHGVQADVLDITWNGGNASASVAFSSSSSFGSSQLIDQANVSFFQFNDTIGRTMSIFTDTSNTSLRVMQPGESIRPDTFSGTTNLNASLFSGSGSAFVGFRVDENVGWFKLSFTDQGPIVYSTGQFADAGETLVVDGKVLLGDVNRDGEVNLLDVTPMIDLISSGEFQAEGDINQDDVVDLLDVGPFIEVLSGQ